MSVTRHGKRVIVHTQCRRQATNAFVGPELRTADQQISHGVLAGKSVGIKDNIAIQNVETTAGSRSLEGYKSPFDATIVALLRRNGASISHRTNMDEHGMGSHSQTSIHGPVTSIYKRRGKCLSPGGSSGGSAVAVATRDCWAALGTDTGGSVRLPAAYNGIVGFKPSYGRLSRWGVFAYANSLDTVGILSRNVADARSVYSVLDKHDERDPTSLSVATRRRIRDCRPKRDARRLRIGVPLAWNISSLAASVRDAWIRTLNALQDNGHDLVPVQMQSTRRALSAYYVIAPAEASSNLAKYDGVRYGHRAESARTNTSEHDRLPLFARTRDEGFGDEVKRRILLGAYTLSADAADNHFVQAQRVRRLVQRDFDHVFAMANVLHDDQDIHTEHDEVDVLVSPTAPTLPPTIEQVKQQTPVEGYMNDVFTVPASLAGLPAINVPVRLSEGDIDHADDGVKTTGLQVVAQFGDDDLVLDLAEQIEQLQMR